MINVLSKSAAEVVLISGTKIELNKYKMLGKVSYSECINWLFRRGATLILSGRFRRNNKGRLIWATKRSCQYRIT
ncbi:hypothetical protein RV12_GL002800 [Enterococcus quebecensis]|nr:hypothetical protein RV12_GL002800 [Enterococcus quebecensis]